MSFQTASALELPFDDDSFNVVLLQHVAMKISDRPRLYREIRRECLDHVIVLSEEHLRRVLKRYLEYYNRSRTHLAVAKDSPVHRPIHREGRITALPILGGLHHCHARQ